MSTGKREAGRDSAEEVRGWFAGRLPDEWFTRPAEILVDREEITIIGHLPPVEAGKAGTDEEAGAQAKGGEAEAGGEAEDDSAAGAKGDAVALGRSRRFREETRDARIGIAQEAEALFGRKVSWGVVSENRKVMFTTLSVPVMTRLRQSERRVLDTLVDAGVARSRSDALAWCVRLVGQHEDSWLADLREALQHVQQVRASGPQA